MTIQIALQQALTKLTEADIDTPRLDAQLLMAWTLKCRREDLMREPEREISERDLLVFEKAVKLRALRRPLPYITGEQGFYGRSFKINRAVLIPRSETELLVEETLKRLQGVENPRIADIGIGSGCISVTLACERPDARFWATDISGNAILLAHKNVVRYNLEDRLTLCQGDLLQPLPKDIQFDAIVSNPPYVTEQELPNLQPEVRDYEPTLALSGQPGATGVNGIDLHCRLLTEAPAYLKPGGWVLMEIGLGQAEKIMSYAQNLGYTSVTIVNDLAGIARVIQAQRSET
jgi:release factor glutamine methyltransferase